MAGILYAICCVYFLLFNNVVDVIADCSDGVDRCEWDHWNSWSICSRTCGGGIRTRTRSYCCDESLDFEDCMIDCGHGMDYAERRGYERQDCNTQCQSGGNFRDGFCRCKDTYYGECCENVCSSIDNCKRRFCNSKSNTKCRECHHDKTLYKRTSFDKKCERMCSWTNHYCWPGRCSQELTTGCKCAPGFKITQTYSETSCQPTESPSILACNTVATGRRGEKKQAKSSSWSRACQYLTDMYGNFYLSSFKFKMTADYKFHITGVSKPEFVNEYRFGITDTGLKVIKLYVSGRRSTISDHKQMVDRSAGEKAVSTRHDSGHIYVSSYKYNLADGQALCLEFYALGGGYLKSKNLETHRISDSVPYQKVLAKREICYRYDNTAPRHCQEVGTCAYDPVQFQKRITRSTVTSVSFNGWFDPIPSGGSSIHASSIESYQLTVNEVPASPGKLKVDYLSNVYSKKVKSNVNKIILTLASDSPRLYCITVEVKDVADNVRQARRFLLYDSTSFIETWNEKPFQITTASGQTNYTWQTHHHNICLSWKDHFLNRFYFDNALLNPIDSDSHGLIFGVYEQTAGVLPVSGTPNIYGIVKVMISWMLNNGRLSPETVVPDFQSQSYCNDFKVKDGQTYTIVVRQIDIVGNTYRENRTVHIDRSVPHINNIWLKKDGYKTLFVHHKTDLSAMELYFEALDPHSGIRQVDWSFGITDSGNELSRGSLSVGVINETICPSNVAECYCPDVGLCELFNYTVPLNKLVAINKHVGNHNRNYYFTIKVTNHAHLFSIEHIDILVDDSPPEVGVVYEGPQQTNDIDYTSRGYFNIHWHGFIDHESGIKSYRIGLAARCLEQTELYNFTSVPDIEFYTDVPHTESSVRIPAHFTGKRYITMVALNNAMSPSVAICSDGITRDLSPPEIRNLTLAHGSWSKTIVCHEGRAWLFHSSVTKILLLNVSSCNSICVKSPQAHLLASVLPSKKVNYTDPEISEIMCTRLSIYNIETIIYLPNDHIYLNWDVEEQDSQMDDFFVGIGTDPSEVESPGIYGYQSTAKRTFFKRKHNGIGSDELFFIFLKAVNKAGLESVTVFGPILIDETPPVCLDVPKVKVIGEDILVVWKNNTIFDIEQKEPISSIYFDIGHGNTSVTPLLRWHLGASSACPQYSGGCFNYSLKKLQTQDNDIGLSFHINMHVFNNAGHVLTVTTDTFRIPSRYPPGHATVIDSDPEFENYKEDTNLHFTPNTLCFRWTGFKHHELVKIEVGVGSNNSTDNVVPYLTVNHTNNYHCIHSSYITFEKSYFALVKASCSGGATITASNGVTLLDRNMLKKSLHVGLGRTCSTAGVLYPVLRNSTTSNISVTFLANIGKRYEINFPSGYMDSVFTQDGIIMSNTNDNFSIVFVPFVISPVIHIVSNHGIINETNQIRILNCPVTKYIDETKHITAHWFYKESKDHGLRFEIAVFQVNNMTSNSSLVPFTQYEPTSHLKTHTFVNVYFASKGCYKLSVKQCSNAQCLQPVLSNQFCIVALPQAQNIRVSHLENVTGACSSRITLRWDAFRSDSLVLFYQWVVSQDSSAKHILTEWQTVKANDTRIYQLRTCIDIPVHLYSTMFGCIRAFDEVGNQGLVCDNINYISSGNYMQNTVYDLDLNSKDWDRILKVLPSSNIGQLYTLLHDNEVDFGTPETQVVGVVLYATDRDVIWYLMLNKHIPDRCEIHSACIGTKHTRTGYVYFDRNMIKLNTIHYICAQSNVTVLERELFSETLDEIKACSNGFVIDNEFPHPGQVEILKSDNFLSSLQNIELVWKDFVENIDARKLGYVNSIQQYSYAIGHRPLGEDIRRFTDVGLRKNVVISDIRIPDGSVVYFTIRATDYAGNSATSVSKGVIVDTSPPSSGQIHIESCYDLCDDSKMYISSINIAIHLSGFKDEESSIDYYELGLGSKPYFIDIIALTIFHDVFIELPLKNSMITDGHEYYLSAKAVNRAGLASEYTVMKVIADKSPPTGGHVLEGQDEKDIDYQTDHRHINAQWKGFDDIHSGILYFRAGLGTNAYKDDIVPFFDVGIEEEIIWSAEFIAGQKYYTTVEACNGAGLCVTRASDGVVIDNSPPIQGLVQIGSDEFHQKFHSHITSVHVQWAGFEDPQSGIDHYELCIGTSQGHCDIVPIINSYLRSNIIKTGIYLPPTTDLYATVTAYNNVRMNVSQTSDSFRVDITPPTVSIRPTFLLENMNIPARRGQWDKSVLRMYWRFDDDESPVARHDVTLVTHHEGHTPVEHVQLGSENELTINLDGKSWLHNGDTYLITVTSCNLAGLCSSAKSNDLIIDSSPPHLGGFTPPMIWENLNSSFEEFKSNITLSWHGFHDQESGLENYFITVSKTFSGNELTNGISTIPVNGFENQKTHSFLLTEKLDTDDILFLTIWAENSVGLNSSLARVSVNVLSSSSLADSAYQKGTLELEKHSCDIHYCNKDCTCAVIGKPCVEVESNVSCKELNETLYDIGGFPYIEVFNGLNEMSLNLTASSACLSGSWRVKDEDHYSKSVKRFEWSMGLYKQPVGEGIFDLRHERPWNDVGLQTQIVHCLPLNKTLVAREKYVIYVRAWFYRDAYALFRSDPITVDHTPPSIRRGRSIIDSDELCNVDFDVIDWIDTITVCWNGVFQEQQGGITYYMLSMGTYVYGDDILTRQNIGLNTSKTLQNLSLSHGTKYFFSVTAYNKLGLHTSAFSDGFIIDIDSPVSGVVFNTLKYRNNAYQSSATSIGITWHGFQDAFSGIRSYYAAISDIPYADENVNFTRTGLQTHYVSKTLKIEHGKTYYGLVKAVDNMGHVSTVAMSKGIKIDNTPPLGYSCQNYSDIEHISNFINGTNERVITLKFRASKNRLYKVNGNVSSLFTENAKLKIRIGRFDAYLPLIKSHNRRNRFEHSFFAPSVGHHDITLELQNDDQTNVMMNMTLSECRQIIEDSRETIHLIQISRSKIAVHMHIADEESSLSKIELGAGITADGFQIKPLSRIYHFNNQHLIHTGALHGTQVFVTVIAENGAGLKSVFHSKPITIDHSSPVINNMVGGLQNVQVNMSGVLKMFTNVNATWDVTDKESGLKRCYCSIGHVPGLDDIHSVWIAQSLTACESNKIQLYHGQQLYLNLKCVNNAELSTEMFTDVLVASTEKPKTSSAILEFVPQNEESSECIYQVGSKFAVQSNHTYLSLKWDGFEDFSGIDHYEYRLSQSGRAWLTNWTETDRDVVQVANVDLANGEVTAEVRAINTGCFVSEPVNASLVIARYVPRLTGQTAKVTRNGNLLNINWADVFETGTGVPISYSLTIGTRRGSADIFDKNCITSMEYDIYIPASTIITPNLKEVFVRIVCIYTTGWRTAFSTNYKLK